MIGLGSDIPEELSSLQIFSDQKRLLQILLNLCSNAIKYTVEGSVRISLNVDLEE